MMRLPLAHPVRTYRLHRLDVRREHMPLGPDRHALDVAADDRFAHLAPGAVTR